MHSHGACVALRLHIRGPVWAPCFTMHPKASVMAKDAKAHNRHMTTQHGKTLNAHAPHTAADAAVDQHPFERLTPDVVLDALASVDLWGDGRLTTLNSYENHVYLAHLDEACQGHTSPWC
jgi:hypothetical protein